jgi:hypothetical protein
MPRDALGRLRELSDGARGFASFSWLGAHRVLGRKLGNGLEQSYLARDGEGVFRLSGASRSGEVLREEYLKASGERALGYEYAYDREGRRLYERQLLRQGRGPSLRYDSIGRIREVQPDLQDPRVPFPTPSVFTRYYPDGSHNPRLVIVDFVEKRMEVDVLDRLTLVDGKPLGPRSGREPRRRRRTRFPLRRAGASGARPPRRRHRGQVRARRRGRLGSARVPAAGPPVAPGGAPSARTARR